MLFDNVEYRPVTPAAQEYVGIVIVSHSATVAAGLRELLGQFADEAVSIIAAGGTADGSLGTNPVRIAEAIGEADAGAGVALLVDMGSAVLSVRHALTEIDGTRAVLADAPLVEGAIAAAVVASTGASLEDVVAAAEEARSVGKL
jgi:dihydroxyacetone kinase phosphotransfer subunit